VFSFLIYEFVLPELRIIHMFLWTCDCGEFGWGESLVEIFWLFKKLLILIFLRDSVKHWLGPFLFKMAFNLRSLMVLSPLLIHLSHRFYFYHRWFAVLISSLYQFLELLHIANSLPSLGVHCVFSWEWISSKWWVLHFLQTLLDIPCCVEIIYVV
jgi:hypothetical protein